VKVPVLSDFFDLWLFECDIFEDFLFECDIFEDEDDIFEDEVSELSEG
jgi:hypothetical protein